MKRKVLSIFALLLLAVSGAVAQTETLLTTITATGKEQELQYGECGNRFIQLYCIWILSIPR